MQSGNFSGGIGAVLVVGASAHKRPIGNIARSAHERAAARRGACNPFGEGYDFTQSGKFVRGAHSSTFERRGSRSQTRCRFVFGFGHRKVPRKLIGCSRALQRLACSLVPRRRHKFGTCLRAAALAKAHTVSIPVGETQKNDVYALEDRLGGRVASGLR